MLETHFNEVAGPEDPKIHLKEASTQVFSCEYCQISRTPILKNICEQLLLPVKSLLSLFHRVFCR